MVRDRGQLLLIGAILIGMTVIGTVVMLNGMEYADAAGSQGQAQVLDDAERTEEMVERDMERLVVSVRDSEPANPSDALRENISTYNNHTRNMSLSKGGSTVNVTLNESASRGYRFQEPSGSNFKPRGAPPNWVVATDISRTERFDVQIDSFHGQTSSSAFLVTVEMGGGDEWKLRAFEENGPTPHEVVIETQSPGSATWSRQCNNVGPPVELNFVTGEAYYQTTDSTCSFPTIDGVATTPYRLVFESSTQANGEFDIIVDREDTADSNAVSTAYPVVPAIDYRYRSAEIVYNRTIRVEGGPS